jgi:hypothetical protein
MTTYYETAVLNEYEYRKRIRAEEEVQKLTDEELERAYRDIKMKEPKWGPFLNI